MSDMIYNERNTEENYDFSEVINNINELEKMILKILYKPEKYKINENNQFYSMGTTTIQVVLLKLLPEVDKENFVETINLLDKKGLTDDLSGIIRCQMNNSGTEILKNRLSKYGEIFCEFYFGNLDK